MKPRTTRSGRVGGIGLLLLGAALISCGRTDTADPTTRPEAEPAGLQVEMSHEVD